jgi:hypothetical protein
MLATDSRRALQVESYGSHWTNCNRCRALDRCPSPIATSKPSSGRWPSSFWSAVDTSAWRESWTVGILAEAQDRKPESLHTPRTGTSDVGSPDLCILNSKIREHSLPVSCSRLNDLARYPRISFQAIQHSGEFFFGGAGNPGADAIDGQCPNLADLRPRISWSNPPPLLSRVSGNPARVLAESKAKAITVPGPIVEDVVTWTKAQAADPPARGRARVEFRPPDVAPQHSGRGEAKSSASPSSASRFSSRGSSFGRLAGEASAREPLEFIGESCLNGLAAVSKIAGGRRVRPPVRVVHCRVSGRLVLGITGYDESSYQLTERLASVDSSATRTLWVATQ